MTIVFAILPILVALGAGYLVGKQLPIRINVLLIRSIAPLVWFMLFLLGFEFGEIIVSADKIAHVLTHAVIFACVSSIGTVLALWFLLRVTHQNKIVSNAHHKQTSRNGSAAKPALKESGIALAMVMAGALLFVVKTHFGMGMGLFSSANCLLLLLFLIGIDFTQIKLHRQWFSGAVLIVPFGVVAGSLLSALLSSWLSGESLTTSLALSSGFGWFTLSSVLIGDAYGNIYGTMALLTDLFRELISIFLLYAVGKHQPKLAIGVAGATALDSTLPMVKQGCHSDAVPLAIVSGFILTALAPLLMTVFLP